MENFASRLRKALTLRNMKQSELCEKTKIPKSAMSQYINGSFEPKQDRLHLMAVVLRVNEAWLSGYDDVPMERFKKAEESSVSSQIQNIDLLYPKNAGQGFAKIPVLGKVAAGIPISAQEDILGWEEVPAEWVKSDNIFALQIKGDSMEPRISEGDIVICRQQPDVENNQIAVVMVNGDEATCKRVVKSSDGIMLISNNPKYPPMQYSNREIEELPVRILGKVIELRVKFG